ncbi:arsenate reductase ArsC [uncultured Methanospirillum sp.]|uniref:arsenate reductase ArsC n=1 Tax=uncultured Methanospirillum sp. TaxID=262503 RepID=UPI0029C8342C|nr:arsenate reductase ArsC [uncultured Methanospirillum sp.]
MEKLKVLFICTHNSARSQMAEGYLRAKYGDQYEACSAGTEITSIHPEAVMVMQEIEIDISNHKSKDIMDFYFNSFDIVFTVCEGAHAVCPVFPGAKERKHRGFVDPASTVGTPEEIRQSFRKARDEIIEWVDEKFGAMSSDLGYL